MPNIYRRNRHWKIFNMIQRRPRRGETEAERRARKRRVKESERRRKRWFNAKKAERKRRRVPPEVYEALE